MDEKIFIISDAHMGGGSAAEEAKKSDWLISFFKYLQTQPCRLVICGDLFDFWFEYRHAVPCRHFQVLAQLSELVRCGIKVDYIAGNHDFWLNSFMEREIGLHLHADDLELSQKGKKIYFCHGDGLMRKDRGYRALKKVLRHPWSVYLYRWVHPDIGVPLALYFSRLSRKADKPKALRKDNDYRAFAFAKIDQGYDVVVLGHTHLAACVAHGPGWYVNAGNWIDAFTYAVIEAGTPSLFGLNGQAQAIAAGSAQGGASTPAE
jgi:UDP-2,3-diacylglucosamine hydrolase